MEGKPLSWTQQPIEKAIKDPNSIFVQEATAADSQDAEQSCDQVAEIGDSVVAFDVPEGRKLDVPLRKALAKVCSNLGRPSRQDFQRFLRSASASRGLVEACAWLRCSARAATARARTPDRENATA